MTETLERTENMASYDYWQNALAGNFGPVHDGDAQPGFYRKRVSKGGPFLPVAIWADGGKIIATVDGKEADAADIWSYVCDKPVTEDAFRARSAGQPWPDEDVAVTRSLAPPPAGDNHPPQDEADQLAAQIEAASENAKAYENITDDETASKAQSARSRLNELSRDADKKRESEKKPHLDAGKNIDAKWQPLVKAAKAAADAIAKALSAHETRKARAIEDARIKAEAARQLALEAERKRALEASPVTGTDAVLPVELPPPPPPPVAAQPIRGAYGRAAAVKVVKVATVEDYDEATTYFRNNAEYRAVIDKLAQKAVDSGYTVPGVKVTEERKVA
jgi:hypothetical protein